MSEKPRFVIGIIGPLSPRSNPRRLGKEIPQPSEEVEFLMKTALFFMGLVNLRYGLKINPIYVFSAMTELG